MKTKTKILLMGVFGLALAHDAGAETIDRPLSGGTVSVKAQAPDSTPDLTDAASIGIVRTDTGELVYCAPVAPSETIWGETGTIQNVGPEVTLQAFAYSGGACGGMQSPGSTDLYRVVFGAPGAPTLLRVE